MIDLSWYDPRAKVAARRIKALELALEKACVWARGSIANTNGCTADELRVEFIKQAKEALPDE